MVVYGGPYCNFSSSLSYLQIVQQEVGLTHVHCWKSANISGINRKISDVAWLLPK